MSAVITKVWLVRLYCDAPGHVPVNDDHYDYADSDAETRAVAVARLRRAGWTLSHAGRAVCPDCQTLAKGLPLVKREWSRPLKSYEDPQS